MTTLAPEKVAHIKKVDQIYRESSSLEDAGKKLNLTRERVRQILQEGREHKIIDYVPSYKKEKNKFNYLKRSYTRETLLKELIEAKNLGTIISKHDITRMSFNNLLNHFQIKEQDFHTEKFRRKWLEKYQEIVNLLGRHPSTYELQINSEWKTMYNAVCRYWGSFEKFRSEYGIEKPPMTIHPNSLQGWQELREQKAKKKQERKQRILDLIEKKGIVDGKMIKEELDITSSLLYVYLHELFAENLIKKVEDGHTFKYLPAEKN